MTVFCFFQSCPKILVVTSHDLGLSLVESQELFQEENEDGGVGPDKFDSLVKLGRIRGESDSGNEFFKNDNQMGVEQGIEVERHEEFIGVDSS